MEPLQIGEKAVPELSGRLRAFVSWLGNNIKSKMPWKKVATWGAVGAVGVGVDYMMKKKSSNGDAQSNYAMSNDMTEQVMSLSNTTPVKERMMPRNGNGIDDLKRLIDGYNNTPVDEFMTRVVCSINELLDYNAKKYLDDPRYITAMAEGIQLALALSFSGLKASRDYTAIHFRAYESAIEGDVSLINARTDLYAKLVKGAIKELGIDLDLSTNNNLSYGRS
jgi:hypothetical protein